MDESLGIAAAPTLDAPADEDDPSCKKKPAASALLGATAQRARIAEPESKALRMFFE